jgi:hypothetical protein
MCQWFANNNFGIYSTDYLTWEFKNSWQSSVFLLQKPTLIDKNVPCSFMLFQSKSGRRKLTRQNQSTNAEIFLEDGLRLTQAAIWVNRN